VSEEADVSPAQAAQLLGVSRRFIDGLLGEGLQTSSNPPVMGGVPRPGLEPGTP
jgi:hypothetical protein